MENDSIEEKRARPTAADEGQQQHQQQHKANQVDDSSGDEEVGANETKPVSVLEILVDKQAAVEDTVALLRKSIPEVPSAPPTAPPAPPAPPSVLKLNEPRPGGSGAMAATIKPSPPAQPVSQPAVKEFESLDTLLTDKKVESVIKSVAGKEAHNIISNALGAIKSTDSIEAKKVALAAGLERLQINLRQPDKAASRNDPNFKLALNLIGLQNHFR